MLRIVPMTLTKAFTYVAKNHRHNRAPQGGLFACGIESDGKLVGVGIVGRPIARRLDNGTTAEITRNCTDGSMNACSMLYGALCRAAKALGYQKAVTYTLAEEPGTSLLAAGFTRVAELPPQPGCTPGMQRRRDAMKMDLFGGQETRPRGAKVRWEREL